MHILTLSLSAIFSLLAQYRYFLLFPITVAEGPIITVIAGYLCRLGFFYWPTAYLIVVGGDLAGDILYYLAGRWGRYQFIEKWGHYLGIKAQKVKDMQKIFERHSANALFFGKFTLGIGGVIILAAGASRVSFRKFIGYCTLGTLPKSALLMLIGAYFGYAYLAISKYFDYTAIITVAVAFVIAGGYYLLERYAKKRLKK